MGTSVVLAKNIQFIVHDYVQTRFVPQLVLQTPNKDERTGLARAEEHATLQYEPPVIYTLGSWEECPKLFSGVLSSCFRSYGLQFRGGVVRSLTLQSAHVPNGTKVHMQEVDIFVLIQVSSAWRLVVSLQR